MTQRAILYINLLIISRFNMPIPLASLGLDSMIGVSAAVLTTSSFLPQIIRAYKTKSMDDVSKYLMLMFSTGTILWMVYGVAHSDPVIIGANGVATIFNLVLLYLKFSYTRSERQAGDGSRNPVNILRGSEEQEEAAGGRKEGNGQKQGK